MSNFAVVDDDGTVLNIIISETKEIAEQSTGKTCTKYTEENPAHIGLKYDSSTLLFEQLAAPSDWDGITPEMPN